MIPTIVTSCKGRLSHLKQSLSTWLEHTPCRVVVVDYDCPDDTTRWVRSLKLSRVHAMEAITGKKTFNKCHALNLGALHAEAGEQVLFLDADTRVTKEFWPWLEPRLGLGKMFLVPPTKTATELAGVLCVDVSGFRVVGGFDEGMSGWGSEDLDIRMRIYLSWHPELVFMPEELFDPIPHSDELRTRFYDEKNKQASHERNLQRLVDNVERYTRVSIFDHMKNPDIARLFHQ